MSNFKIVTGLMGKAGSGKTTTTRLLRDHFGFIGLEADQFGHAALEMEKEKIREVFGDDILIDNHIDRKKLGSLVFSNGEKLMQLNRIVHPRIKSEIRRVIDEGADGFYVIDAAILFEIGLDELCDYIVFVESPKEIIEKRLKEERDWSESKIEGVIKAQKYLSLLRERSDFVLFNSGSEKKLLRQLEFFVHCIRD